MFESCAIFQNKTAQRPLIALQFLYYLCLGLQLSLFNWTLPEINYFLSSQSLNSKKKSMTKVTELVVTEFTF